MKSEIGMWKNYHLKIRTSYLKDSGWWSLREVHEGCFFPPDLPMEKWSPLGEFFICTYRGPFKVCHTFPIIQLVVTLFKHANFWLRKASYSPLKVEWILGHFCNHPKSLTQYNKRKKKHNFIKGHFMKSQDNMTMNS